MMRFYGLGLREVRKLPYDEFSVLLKTIPVLEAREMLMQITVGDFPNLKKERRQKLHRELHKTAFPKIHADKETLPIEALAHFLAGVGNGR